MSLFTSDKSLPPPPPHSLKGVIPTMVNWDFLSPYVSHLQQRNVGCKQSLHNCPPCLRWTVRRSQGFRPHFQGAQSLVRNRESLAHIEIHMQYENQRQSLSQGSKADFQRRETVKQILTSTTELNENRRCSRLSKSLKTGKCCFWVLWISQCS